MLIHLPIVILASLPSHRYRTAFRNSTSRGNADPKAARRPSWKNASRMKPPHAINFNRNGFNFLPTTKPFA